MKILVATHNPTKVEWFKHSLGDLGLEIISLEDIGYSLRCCEDGDTFKTNAIIKAIEPLIEFGPNFDNVDDKFIVVADDGGIFIEGYNGDKLGLLSGRTGKTPYELNYSILDEFNGESKSAWNVAKKSRNVKFEGCTSVAWFGHDGKIHFRTIEGESFKDGLRIVSMAPDSLPWSSNNIYDIIEIKNPYNDKPILLSNITLDEQMDILGISNMHLVVRGWMRTVLIPKDELSDNL